MQFPHGVQLTLQEETSSSYDWTYNEATNYDPAPNTGLPDPRVVAAVQGLQVSSQLRQSSDGSWRISLVASWDASTDPGVLFGGAIELVVRNASSGALLGIPRVSGDATPVVLAEAVNDGSAWNVWARAYNNIAYSSWAFAGTYAVSGPSDAPPAPTGFAAADDGFGVRRTWTESTSAAVVRYEIRTGASWESGTPIGAVMANTLCYRPQTAGTTTYRLSAIEEWGNASTA